MLSCRCYVLFGSLCFGWGTDKTPNFSEEDRRTVESLRLVTGEKRKIKIIWLRDIRTIFKCLTDLHKAKKIAAFSVVPRAGPGKRMAVKRGILLQH